MTLSKEEKGEAGKVPHKLKVELERLWKVKKYFGCLCCKSFWMVIKILQETEEVKDKEPGYNQRDGLLCARSLGTL